MALPLPRLTSYQHNLCCWVVLSSTALTGGNIQRNKVVLNPLMRLFLLALSFVYSLLWGLIALTQFTLRLNLLQTVQSSPRCRWGRLLKYWKGLLWPWAAAATPTQQPITPGTEGIRRSSAMDPFWISSTSAPRTVGTTAAGLRICTGRRIQRLYLWTFSVSARLKPDLFWIGFNDHFPRVCINTIISCFQGRSASYLFDS